MTHDELLGAISIQLVHLPPYALGGPAPYLRAFAAVVELHKPELMISSSYCVECTINLETIIYPCPTIQAIEKELT